MKGGQSSSSACELSAVLTELIKLLLQLWDEHLTANTQFHDHICPGCTIPAAWLPEPEV